MLRSIIPYAAGILIASSITIKREATEDHNMTDYCHNISQFSGIHYCDIFTICCSRDHQLSATVCGKEEKKCTVDPVTKNVSEYSCILKECYVPVAIEDGNSTENGTIGNMIDGATNLVQNITKPADDETSSTENVPETTTTIATDSQTAAETTTEVASDTSSPAEGDSATKSSGEAPATGPEQKKPAARPEGEDPTATGKPDNSAPSIIGTSLLLMATVIFC